MKKEKLIFVIANRGDDTRVVKEVDSLSKKFDLYFIGISKKPLDSSIFNKTFKAIRIPFSHKNIFSFFIVNTVLLFYKLYYGIRKMHVVDEQVWIFLIHNFILFDVVLDIYDSYFLKLNLHGEKFMFLKHVVYGSTKKIIVTDSERFKLLPEVYQNKSIVIPNYPSKSDIPQWKNDKEKDSFSGICLGFFGTLTRDRGGDIGNELLAHDDVRLISAGWVYDDFSKKLMLNKKCDFLGELKQKEVLAIIKNDIDFLLCCYPEDNLNNIYASPNKIWDAVACGKPVIINKGAKISKFVEDNKLGILVDYKSFDKKQVVQLMKNYNKKHSDFSIDGSNFIWEKFEFQLHKLHS